MVLGAILPTLGVLAGATAGILGITLGMAIQGPLQRELAYAGNQLWPNNQPPEVNLVDMRWRRLISEEEYKAAMRKLGYDEVWAERIFQSTQALLSGIELVTLFRRGVIDEKEFYAQMKRAHFTEEAAQRLLKATEHWPGPSDLIRFAVREVYREDLVERFGYDEGFPSDERIEEIKSMSPSERQRLSGMDRLIADSLAVGLPPEWLKRYWRAHWQLPSVTLALEMWHRLRPQFEDEVPVTDEDIDTLLRQQDILPWWIPRIKKISFRLPTRVDLRRMIRYGLLSPEEAEKLYNQLGYSPEHARLLTQLAVMDALEEERSLSVGMIKKAYVLGELKREDAEELLKDLNYSDESIAILLDTWELEQREKELDDQVQTLVNLFLTDAISEEQLLLELDKLALPAAKRDRIWSSAVRRKKGRRSELSKEDLRKLFVNGILSKTEVMELLLKKGFSEKEVAWLIQLWELEKPSSGVTTSA